MLLLVVRVVWVVLGWAVWVVVVVVVVVVVDDVAVAVLRSRNSHAVFRH